MNFFINILILFGGKMIEDILYFIKKRFENTNANWNNGNCYWFAKILTERFPELDIYYLPNEGHFIAGDGETFFDYNGLITDKKFCINFQRIAEEDPLWYERLIRDCVL